MKTKVFRRSIVIAVLLCIICAIAWAMVNQPRLSDLIGHNITLPAVESMTVQIVQFDSFSAGTPVEMWEKDRIAVKVVDAGSNSVYPVGAELSLALDLAWPKPEIYLTDGTLYEPNWDDLDLKQIGWEYGRYLYVEFQCYLEGYSEGKHFYNLLFPSYIKAVEDTNVSK